MKILFVKTFLVILLPNLIQNTILDLNILNNPLLNKSPYLISKDLNESIYQFFKNFTNFSYIINKKKDEIIFSKKNFYINFITMFNKKLIFRIKFIKKSIII